MDKKIIKYKLKKNKLEEKIIDMLNLKKEDYENKIINSNDNQIITDKVENFFNNIKFNNKEQLVIIVYGLYSVGKTTFISHLENYIRIMIINSTIKKTNIDLIQKFIIHLDNIDFLKDLYLSSKITIIECNINTINKINLLISDLNISNVINVNIIPKNTIILKNKIINKIIGDIINKSDNFINNFITYIRENNIIEIEEMNSFINQINLLKTKNKILTDHDFIFLDNIINSYYLNIITLSNNLVIQSNIKNIIYNI